VVVLDGVFSRSDDEKAHFHEASLLQPEHWARLQGVVQRRVLRYFRNHGLLDELDTRDMLSWQGSGGFSIDASVRIEGDDRAGIERLLRYCARPPFALERLHALAGVASLASPDARLLYRFPKPTPDGRTEIILAFLTDPPVLSAILLHLDLPHRPPPLAPARGPPQRDFLLDQTPSFDPADPEPVPDVQFDQSLPDDFDD